MQLLVNYTFGIELAQITDTFVFILGPVAVSTPAKLVSPGYVINGTMSVTKSELYFEMDDDDEENKKIDPKVSAIVIRTSERSNIKNSKLWVGGFALGSVIECLL